MADRSPKTSQPPQYPRATTVSSAPTRFTMPPTTTRSSSSSSSLSNQLIGLLALTISGTILLGLTGMSITVGVMGLIFIGPLVLITSPLWVPLLAMVCVTGFGFLSLCGFGGATYVALSWVYKRVSGRNPPGWSRVDDARSRIAGAANQMTIIARDSGGYLLSKVKDAAPSA